MPSIEVGLAHHSAELGRATSGAIKVVACQLPRDWCVEYELLRLKAKLVVSRPNADYCSGLKAVLLSDGLVQIVPTDLFPYWGANACGRLSSLTGVNREA